MFIARSAARITRARTLFVLLALLPCVALVAWAIHRRSAAHRDAVRLGWQRQLGLPLAVAAIDHPRPGVVRGFDCVIKAADGSSALSTPGIEVETTANEVRLRLDRLRCDASAAAVLAGVARDWLERGARYDRNCVIEVADFAWETAEPDAPTTLKIECVAHDGSRAVRIVRPAATDTADEVRIVRTTDPPSRDDKVIEPPEVRVEIEAECRRPLPFAILAACVAGSPLAGLEAGPRAAATGTLQATGNTDGWSGTARGLVERVDLAVITATFTGGASGEATISVDELRWSGDRIETCDLGCTAGRGQVAQPLLDSLVTTLGCRPGAAYGPADGRQRSFDSAAWRLRIDDRGAELRDGPGGGLATLGGQSLVDPPAGGFPVERLAWLISPRGSTFVPTGGPGGWLMSILPKSGGR